jgi:hypothetical protein
VITSDRAPQDLDGIAPRILSRLSWGLVADINSADFELRYNIIVAKLAALPAVEMPRNVVDFLARRVTSSVRELEGALNRIAAYAMMTGREIDVAFVEEVLANVLRANQRRISIDEIQTQVAEHYRIRKAEMTSARRAREVARPRQVAMYLSKQLTPKSLPDIGRRFGGRDHTTVIHAVKPDREAARQRFGARRRHPAADPPARRLSNLRHFRGSVAKAHDSRRRATADEGLWRNEQVDVEIGVELERDVASKLYMLFLVLADRHVSRLVQKDVCGLEHRIGVEADRRTFAVLARFLLELGHPVQPADSGGALKEPRELRMGLDGALREEHRFGRIDAACDQRRRHFADIRPKLGRIDSDGERVEVGKEEQKRVPAFDLLLHSDPAEDRAKQIAEVQIARRLNSGNDSRLALAHAFTFLRRRRISRSSLSMAPMNQAIAK